MANGYQNPLDMIKDPRFRMMMGANLMGQKGTWNNPMSGTQAFGNALTGTMDMMQKQRQQRLLEQYRQAMMEQMKANTAGSKRKQDLAESQYREKMEMLKMPWTQGKTGTGQAYMQHPYHGVQMGTRPRAGGLLGGLDMTDPNVRQKLLGGPGGTPGIAPEAGDGTPSFWDAIKGNAANLFTNPLDQLQKFDEATTFNVLGDQAPKPNYPAGAPMTGTIRKPGLGGTQPDESGSMLRGFVSKYSGRPQTGKKYNLPSSEVTDTTVTEEEKQAASRAYLDIKRNLYKQDPDTLRAFLENTRGLNEYQKGVILKQIERRESKNPNWERIWGK